MSMTDPVADMLSRIRNAHLAKHESVDIPASNLKTSIARILRAEGFVGNFKEIEVGPRKYLRLYLKYEESGMPVIRGLVRISKPGRRVYVNSRKIPRVRGGLGISILTTPRGVITDKEAKVDKVGGEVLCQVW